MQGAPFATGKRSRISAAILMNPPIFILDLAQLAQENLISFIRLLGGDKKRILPRNGGACGINPGDFADSKTRRHSVIGNVEPVSGAHPNELRRSRLSFDNIIVIKQPKVFFRYCGGSKQRREGVCMGLFVMEFFRFFSKTGWRRDAQIGCGDAGFGKFQSPFAAQEPRNRGFINIHCLRETRLSFRAIAGKRIFDPADFCVHWPKMRLPGFKIDGQNRNKFANKLRNSQHKASIVGAGIEKGAYGVRSTRTRSSIERYQFSVGKTRKPARCFASGIPTHIRCGQSAKAEPGRRQTRGASPGRGACRSENTAGSYRKIPESPIIDDSLMLRAGPRSGIW